MPASPEVATSGCMHSTAPVRSRVCFPMDRAALTMALSDSALREAHGAMPAVHDPIDEDPTATAAQSPWGIDVDLGLSSDSSRGGGDAGDATDDDGWGVDIDIGAVSPPEAVDTSVAAEGDADSNGDGASSFAGDADFDDDDDFDSVGGKSGTEDFAVFTAGGVAAELDVLEGRQGATADALPDRSGPPPDCAGRSVGLDRTGALRPIPGIRLLKTGQMAYVPETQVRFQVGQCYLRGLTWVTVAAAGAVNRRHDA